jgi:hypothetical protein
MGTGFKKQKNAMKKQFLATAVKEIERLEKDNHALKTDPNTVIGQFIGQFREVYGQNSRLSVLAACLLSKLGGTSAVSVEEMEAFKGHRINIKWDLPEGVEKHEDAKEYIFSFEAVKDQPQPTVTLEPVQPTEELGKNELTETSAEPEVQAEGSEHIKYTPEFAEFINQQKTEAPDAAQPVT